MKLKPKETDIKIGEDDLMSKENKPTSRQHFVPQSYLRNFTSTPHLPKEKQRIHVFDKHENKHENKYRGELPIEKVARVKHLYAYDLLKILDLQEYDSNTFNFNNVEIERSQAAEKMFGNTLEPLQAETIREIEKIVKATKTYSTDGKWAFSRPQSVISPELKEKLATCIIFQYLRTKTMSDNLATQYNKVFEHCEHWENYFNDNNNCESIAKFKKMSSSFTQEMIKNGDASKGIPLSDLKNFAHKASTNKDFRAFMMTQIFASLEIAPVLVKKLLQYEFCILVNLSDDVFITSDVPVQPRNYDKQNITPYFGAMDTEIWFPITPNICICATNYNGGTGEFDGRVWSDNTGELVKRSNYYQYHFADRFVFSSVNNFSSILQMPM